MTLRPWRAQYIKETKGRHCRQLNHAAAQGFQQLICYEVVTWCVPRHLNFLVNGVQPVILRRDDWECLAEPSGGCQEIKVSFLERCCDLAVVVAVYRQANTVNWFEACITLQVNNSQASPLV